MGRKAGDYTLNFGKIDIAALVRKYYFACEPTALMFQQRIIASNSAHTTMAVIENENFMPDKLENVRCWHCKIFIKQKPLGIALDYEHDRTMSSVSRILLHQENTANETHETDFFTTEGVVHSFDCMYSYASQQIKLGNPDYKNSLNAINYLFYRINGFYKSDWDNEFLTPWKLLKEFGGEMTLDDYTAFIIAGGRTEISFNFVTPLMYVKKKNVKKITGN